MKMEKLQIVHRALVATALTGFLLPVVPAEVHASPSKPSAPAAESRRQSLEGTWRVQITPRHCQTQTPFRPPFPAMASYAKGGIMTTSDSAFNPALRGAGHGAWTHRHDQTYEVVSEAFFFNSAGAMTGTQRLVQTLTLTGPDTFEATVAAEVLDLERNVVSSGCATSTGTRMR